MFNSGDFIKINKGIFLPDGYGGTLYIPSAAFILVVDYKENIFSFLCGKLLWIVKITDCLQIYFYPGSHEKVN